MEKVQGIVYAYTPEKRYDMVRDLGIDWIRLNVPFPWTDRLDGTISPRWESVKAAIREAAEAGLSVMPSTPTIFALACEKPVAAGMGLLSTGS